MGDIEMTVLLVVALVGFAWVIVRVGRGLSAGGQGSARADTFASGPGIGTDHADALRANGKSDRRDA